jgi:hypothetical protein
MLAFCLSVCKLLEEWPSMESVLGVSYPAAFWYDATLLLFGDLQEQALSIWQTQSKNLAFMAI